MNESKYYECKVAVCTPKMTDHIMARSQKTSFNLQSMPVAKYGSAYIHQKPEHRATLNYIHSERTNLNQSWHKEYQANGHPKTLRNYLADTKKIVKAKTGRAMQKRAEEKVIGEAVAVIDDETSMDDLKKLGKAMEDRFGWTCVQIHIHKDEGYLGKRADDMKHREGKYNLHAHMFFITTNLATGKSWKMQVGDGSAMQDITAKALNLTRGERKGSKKSKAIETLNVVEYKQVLAEQALKQIEKEKESISTDLRRSEERASKLEEQLSQLNMAIRDAGAKLYAKQMALEDEKERKTLSDLLQTMREVADTIANYLAREVGDLWCRYKEQWDRWYKGRNVTELDKIGVWFGRAVTDRQLGETYTADRSAGNLLVNGISVPEMERRQRQRQ